MCATGNCQACLDTAHIQLPNGNNGNYTVASEEAPGSNCLYGGVKIETYNGVTNALVSTYYACNAEGYNDLHYKAYIKDQSGTNVPDVTPIVDGIGGTWSRISTGNYRYVKSGAGFTTSNVFFTLTNGKDEEEARCKLQVTNSTTITLLTYDNTGNLSDDLIEQMFIGIQVKV